MPLQALSHCRDRASRADNGGIASQLGYEVVGCNMDMAGRNLALADAGFLAMVEASRNEVRRPQSRRFPAAEHR